MADPSTPKPITDESYENAVNQLARFADDPCNPHATERSELLRRFNCAAFESGDEPNGEIVTEEDRQAGLVLVVYLARENALKRAFRSR
jgi:hypothetical protein